MVGRTGTFSTGTNPINGPNSPKFGLIGRGTHFACCAFSRSSCPLFDLDNAVPRSQSGCIRLAVGVETLAKIEVRLIA